MVSVKQVLRGWVEKAIGPLIGDQTIFRTLRQILGDSGSVVTSPYKQSVWVYAAINSIAANLSRVPFLLKKDAGDALEPDIIESGPLYQLFQNPNPYMTQKALIEATAIFYSLRGECFWVMEGRKNVTEIPKEIWVFDPMRFEPVLDPKYKVLVGWKYRGKTEAFFSTDEVIQFKMYNPYDDLHGLAPLEAARLSIDNDYYASVYNKSFFKNGAKIGGFLSVDGELDQDQYDRLRSQFDDVHQGAEKAHKIYLAEGGAKFTEAKMSQKDMDYIDGKNMSRQEILAVYKVNEVVLGVYKDIKSYEGIRAAHKAFWEECLMPKITYFEEHLWATFFSKIGVRRGRGRIWGEFDLANVGPLQANYAEKIDTAMKMFHMGWPINHVNRRLQLGMKDVPWGDEWWVPGGFLPVTSIGKEPKKEPEEDPETPEEDSDEKVESIVSPLAKNMREAMRTMLFYQRKRAIEQANGTKNWNKIEHKKDYDKFLISFKENIDASIMTGIVFVQQQYGGTLIPLNSFSQEIEKFKTVRSETVLYGFKTVVENLITTLNDSTHLSALELSDRIRKAFNLLQSKTTSLAKLEADAAFSKGRELASSFIKEQLEGVLKIESTQLIGGEED